VRAGTLLTTSGPFSFSLLLVSFIFPLQRMSSASALEGKKERKKERKKDTPGVLSALSRQGWLGVGSNSAAVVCHPVNTKCSSQEAIDIFTRKTLSVPHYPPKNDGSAIKACIDGLSRHFTIQQS
jgi:hypothetical protein